MKEDIKRKRRYKEKEKYKENLRKFHEKVIKEWQKTQ